MSSKGAGKSVHVVMSLKPDCPAVRSRSWRQQPEKLGCLPIPKHIKLPACDHSEQRLHCALKSIGCQKLQKITVKTCIANFDQTVPDTRVVCIDSLCYGNLPTPYFKLHSRPWSQKNRPMNEQIVRSHKLPAFSSVLSLWLLVVSVTCLSAL